MKPVAISFVALLLAPAVAAAHPVKTRLAQSGVEFLGDELARLIPPYFEPSAFTTVLADPCPGERAITFTQFNTGMSLDVSRFNLSVTPVGMLRLDADVAVHAAGEATIDNLYACFGEELCDDTLAITAGRVVIELDAWLDGAQQPRVAVAFVDFIADEDDVRLTFSNCTIDSVSNWLVSSAKGWILETVLAKVEVTARDSLAPALERFLGGFGQAGTSIASSRFSSVMTGLDLSPTGLAVAVDADISSPLGVAACVSGGDPGEPASHDGLAPALGTEAAPHLAVAVNLGLVDDALYHFWREGLLCLSPDALRAYGVELDLAAVGTMLPGFPAGTTFSLRATVTVPPRVQAMADEGVSLRLLVHGLEADLVATPPGEPERTLHLSLDVSAAGAMLLDPESNALSMAMDSVTLDRLEVADGIGLDALGFDFARVEALLEDRVLPELLAGLGEVPVIGSVFGVAGYHLIPRRLRTTDGWLVAKADIFRAPEGDIFAPDTFFAELPAGPVRPTDAALRLEGVDGQVPTELLRYRVTVDGVRRAPTAITSVRLGEPGRTATYRVEVSAIDLAGNTDPTPATADVTVDGLAPLVEITDGPNGVLDTARPMLEWTASDDLTPASGLVAHVEVSRLSTGGSRELEQEFVLVAGETKLRLELEPGVAYLVSLRVHDAAGNRGSASRAFSVSADASDANTGCACSIGARGSHSAAGGALLCVGLALLLVRRRRVR